MISGVDYSAGTPGSAALKADGRFFCVRYLADDWRGIFPGEYQELISNGVDVAAVFESWGDQRQFSGEEQGIVDATYAQGKLNRTGMPPNLPIYFATDWDAQDEDMPAIDAYLWGAATVLGAGRVGVYGGYSVIDHCNAVNSAQWFWQTSAWEYGRGLHPSCHLYQHTYNYFINGTNCDLTDAYQDNYGQVSKFDGVPDPVPVAPDPQFAIPHLPDFYLRVNVQASPSSFTFEGDHWWPQRANVKANHPTFTYSRPDVHSPYSGPPVAEGDKIHCEWIFDDAENKTWLVNKSGYFFGGRFDPKLSIPQSRKKKAA